MRTASLLLAALLCGGPARADESPSPAPAAAPAKTIRVVVLDPDGRPLPDATVLASIWTTEPDFKATREYETDPAGAAQVALPETYTIVRLWAWKKPLVTLFAGWEEKELATGLGLPEEYVFRLEHGVPAAGRVLSEDGEPVAGAKVEIGLAEESEQPGGDGRARFQCDMDEADFATTDADGRWRIEHIPDPGRARLEVRARHPEYVAEGGTPLRSEPAVSTLKRGVVPVGRVTGPDGAPIADALVIPQGDAKRGARTDADGRYRLRAVAPGTTTLAVFAPGFAPQSRRADLRPGGPSEDFRLEPGKALRVRIVDAEGRPLPKAYLSPRRWGGSDVLENLTFSGIDVGIPRRADDSGLWSWNGAPADPFKLEIGVNGFAPVEIEVAGGEPERTVTLRPEHRITGRVANAATGESIPAFTVTPIDVFRPDWLHAERGNAVRGKDGRLDYLASRTDIPLRLRVEAAGYRTQTGPEFRVGDDSPRTQDFLLEPSPPLSGLVTDADGRPVPNAEVLLATPTQEADLGEGYSSEWGNHTTRTDPEGRFAIPHPGEPWTVIARADAGIAVSAESPAEEYDAGTLNLRPWASVRGRFFDGGRPVSEATVDLNPIRIDSLDRPQIEFGLSARTDAEGRFEFPKALPGPSALSVFLGPWRDDGYRSGPHVPLDLAPGAAVEQDLGTPGAALNGKVTLTGRVPADLNCTYSINYLVRRETGLAPPPEVAALGFDVAAGWQETWPHTREGKAYLSTLRHWFVKLAPDGSFRVSGVPAGEYVLTVAVYAKPAGCLIDPLARTTVPVTVTPDDVARRELSLPDVPAEVEPVPAVGDTPAIAFRLPDGAPGTLADRRGRLTLVHFWASWCGPCRAQLPALRRLHEQHADRGLDLLGLSLDEEDDAWHAALSRSDHPGAQGLIGPDNDAGVSGVPAYWLLAPDGRILAKGYTPDDLTPAISEHLK